MESLSSLVFQYLHAIWRRKWIVALAAWAVCVVGWSVVAMIPSRYESTARVYVDADQLLTPLLRGIAVDVDPGQQLDVLQHTLLSRPNMEQLMHMADLDRYVKTAADKDALIQKLIQQIVIIPQTRNLFVISYQDTDPTTARNVVQSLLTIFAENTAGTQRAQMDNAQRFLNDQIALYEQQLRDAEKRNADFRTAHLDVLSGAASAASIDSLRKLLEQTKNDLQDAIVKRDEVQKNMEGLVPVGNLDATAASAALAAGGPNAEQRLVALQQQLVDLRLRDTDQHPDVIALKNQISALSAEIAAAKGLKSRDAASGEARPHQGLERGLRSGPNPSLGRPVPGGLAAASGRPGPGRARPRHRHRPIPARRRRPDGRHGPRLRHPQEELRGAAVAARSDQPAQAADTTADKIQFRIVDAPQVPTVPFAPNRPLLFSVVMMAGVLGGLAIPILLTQIDRSYTTLQRLRGLGLPVLGGVTYVSLFKSRSQGMMETAGFGASAVALMMIYGVLIVLSVNLHRVMSGSWADDRRNFAQADRARRRPSARPRASPAAPAPPPPRRRSTIPMCRRRPTAPFMRRKAPWPPNRPIANPCWPGRPPCAIAAPGRRPRPRPPMKRTSTRIEQAPAPRSAARSRSTATAWRATASPFPRPGARAWPKSSASSSARWSEITWKRPPTTR